MLLLTSKSVTLQQVKANNESSGLKFLQYLDKLFKAILLYYTQRCLGTLIDDVIHGKAG